MKRPRWLMIEQNTWLYSLAYLSIFVFSEHVGSLYPLTILLQVLVLFIFWLQSRFADKKDLGGAEVLSFFLLIVALWGMVNGCAGRVLELEDPGWRDRAPVNYEEEEDREPFVP